MYARQPLGVGGGGETSLSPLGTNLQAAQALNSGLEETVIAPTDVPTVEMNPILTLELRGR